MPASTLAATPHLCDILAQPEALERIPAGFTDRKDPPAFAH